MASIATEPLAAHGGKPAVPNCPPDRFAWPIVTQEDEQAILDVLQNRSMSGTDVTKLFEQEFASWNGTEFALGVCNGTAGLLAAMWACGVGAGSEIICPAITYWASAAPALQIGATVNFADIDPETLCIAPADIEHRIGPDTRAIVVVHYCGHPCDMDAILPIARKHGLKVIEDASHAHGGLYKGRKVAALGDIAVMSMMTGKSFAIGEAGMIVTDDRDLYERCVAFGHYERTGVASNYNPADGQITSDDLKTFAGLPLGGAKHRMNQWCSAMGRVQLKHYEARIAEIQSAMNRFWDLLEDVPGIKAHRTEAESGSTMGGWYYARGLYRAEELGGLSCAKFCQAVRAEGVPTATPGANQPLHTHAYFHQADIFRQGKPTALSFGQRDVRQGPGSLPVSESINEIALGVPWFKRDEPEFIQQVTDAYRKVALQAEKLLL